MNHTSTWQPSASIANLKQRAAILKTIRDFFATREVMEVETPLMCHTSVTDPFIQSIPALFQAHPSSLEQRFYLQTSPEYAMKRLLAAGSGPIYQLGKAFRQGEIGQVHNPEFTMLEWYRPGFDHHQLMDEMDDLLQLILKTEKAERISYADLFKAYLNINPHNTTVAELKTCADQHQLDIAIETTDVDTWLLLLLTHCIEPHMGKTKPCFLYDFPVTQAALAKIQPGNPPVASRFEVYFKGIELANGFHELQQVAEQRSRFEKNIAERKALQLTDMPIDEFFLAALSHGLPDCAGVALGIDRLVMLATQHDCLQDVISFDFVRV
ncbi:MAG: elongation factor P--(R)-beta-lysine ligase [Gammaproteobacteria bacterium]